MNGRIRHCRMHCSVTHHRTRRNVVLVTATPTEDGGLVVAETPSEYGSDSAYTLVVRRPVSIAVVHAGGFFTSPIAHVRLLHQVASFSGAEQRVLEVGECSSSNSQEVGYARIDEIKELSRKTDVRLI
ncbi:hypothetical protein VNO80_01559 [Phaseolus coccineus]|uniref:Uncharacterized protein n=1 Tax=Phaseolus coccineus TaxID=3886 RepID=A0AAN9WWY3_PHACN